MDSPTKSSPALKISQDPSEELDCLKKQYLELSDKILHVLPTLLSMIDFQKTNNYVLVAQRMKEGYYGTVVEGAFKAPTFGDYHGFLSDINPKIKDIL